MHEIDLIHISRKKGFQKEKGRIKRCALNLSMLFDNYASEIASFGQVASQAPQSMQASASIE